MSSSLGCFFLDTNIILSEILGENKARIEQMKSDSSFHKINSYISDSVENEVEKKIRQATTFLGDVIRITIPGHLLESRQKSGISPKDSLTSFDIKCLEELFSCYYNYIKETKFGLLSAISVIEEWIISFLGNKLNEGLTISIEDFQTKLVEKLLELTSDIDSLFDYLITFEKSFVTKKTIPLDTRVVRSVNALRIHYPDCTHIASAIIHQFNSKEKTVFVTLDFTSILNKKQIISDHLGIMCSDPLYALHHLL